MSDVYRAQDERLDRTVAVKVLRGGTADHERFAEETALLCTLDHPHLVRLHDAGEHDGVPYLVLNLVEGTLGERLAEGPLPPQEVARKGGEIASALDYLHGRGVVHRDIKPSNILLREDGSACLADLGAALSLDGPRLTATGLMIGTPLYLAPEQASAGEVGPAADIYSLGLVLTEAATGAAVFTGTHQEIMAARVVGSPVVPETVPAPLRSLLQSMLALEPALRPNAAEVGAQLAEMRGADLEASDIDPRDTAADTAVMAASTMVMPSLPPPADGTDQAGMKPLMGVAALERGGRRFRDWVRADRDRAMLVGIGLLFAVVVLAGLASRGSGGAPERVDTSNSVVVTTLPATTIAPPTTVAPAPQPADQAPCEGGCGNGRAGEKKDKDGDD
jgi:serine/threonine protein kinase